MPRARYEFDIEIRYKVLFIIVHPPLRHGVLTDSVRKLPLHKRSGACLMLFVQTRLLPPLLVDDAVDFQAVRQCRSNKRVPSQTIRA